MIIIHILYNIISCPVNQCWVAYALLRFVSCARKSLCDNRTSNLLEKSPGKLWLCITIFKTIIIIKNLTSTAIFNSKQCWVNVQLTQAFCMLSMQLYFKVSFSGNMPNAQQAEYCFKYHSRTCNWGKPLYII